MKRRYFAQMSNCMARQTAKVAEDNGKQACETGIAAAGEGCQGARACPKRIDDEAPSARVREYLKTFRFLSLHEAQLLKPTRLLPFFWQPFSTPIRANNECTQIYVEEAARKLGG
jgi:hypothetical protein